MISAVIGVRLPRWFGGLLNHVAVIFFFMYLSISSTFCSIRRAKTSGGTSGVNVIAFMYQNVSSAVLSLETNKGLSNSDSHFDREARECSRMSSYDSETTNSLVLSSNDSEIGMVIRSTL